MGKIWFLLYNIAGIPLQYLFYHIAKFFNKKIAEGIKGRKGQYEKIKRALSSVVVTRRKILFHCVSVGEWEQALPLITKLKSENEKIYVIVAFFSPSGYNYVKDHPEIDLKIYLPFDSFLRTKKFLKLIQPDLWVTVKHDIWPNLMFAAKRLKIPTVLIDATLPENSRRTMRAMRNFNQHVYGSFDFIFPISDDDSSRFFSIFQRKERIFVTGDTRFDQVYNRGQKALKNPDIPLFDNNDYGTFIAGSIWPSDEKYVLPAVKELLSKYESLNIIIAPHETEEHYLDGIESFLKSEKIASKRYSEISSNGKNGTRVAIIDSVGLLVKLYSQSDIAYVGGSFGPGVHNVMEPGILGIPVLFGPRYTNSFEAGELIKCGGGFAVNNTREITDIIENFLNNREKRESAGKNAGNLIRQNLGATDKIYNILKEKYDFIS